VEGLLPTLREIIAAFGPVSGSMLIVTCALPPSRTISVTLPTVTSLTLTVDLGTRSSTSANCAVMVIGSSPVSGPPGKGRE